MNSERAVLAQTFFEAARTLVIEHRARQEDCDRLHRQIHQVHADHAIRSSEDAAQLAARHRDIELLRTWLTEAQHLASLEAERLRTIYSSSGWRMTGPFRRILSRARCCVGSCAGRPGPRDRSSGHCGTAASRRAPRPSRPVIDVIIPVYNQIPLVQACLDSVLRTRDPSRHEVIVIDDCSTDAELRAYLSKCATDRTITLLTNTENLGFTKSVNRGMKFHPDRDVILLNSDTVVYGNWIDRLHTAACADPRIATATPLTNPGHIGCYPGRIPTGDVRFEITDEALDQLADAANPRRSVDVHTAFEFCMFIKRSCLREIGLFDEQHFPFGYGEESDFCYRAAKLGWRHVICGNVFVRHWEGQSFGEKKKQLVSRMLNVFTSFASREGSKFIARDPVRPLRLALDIARAKRTLDGRTALQCYVLPEPIEDGISVVVDPDHKTLKLVAAAGPARIQTAGRGCSAERDASSFGGGHAQRPDGGGPRPPRARDFRPTLRTRSRRAGQRHRPGAATRPHEIAVQ